jgi:hypothetical protein
MGEKKAEKRALESDGRTVRGANGEHSGIVSLTAKSR